MIKTIFVMPTPHHISWTKGDNISCDWAKHDDPDNDEQRVY